MSLVTVVLPVFNAAAALPEAIASIERQTFTDYEVVAIDDGSTDESGAMLAEWARRDARVRVIVHPENQHVAVALNTGLAAARGKLVIRADADDVNVAGRFATLVATAEQRPELAVIGSAVWSGGRMRRMPPGAEAIRARTLWEPAFMHPTVLINREVTGGVSYDPAFSGIEDVELWWRLVFRHPTLNLREPLVHYRVTGGSVSRRLGPRRLEQEHALDRRIAADLGVAHVAGGGLACRLGNRVARVAPEAVAAHVLNVARAARRRGLAPAAELRREVLRQTWRLWRFNGRGSWSRDAAGLVRATARLIGGWGAG